MPDALTVAQVNTQIKRLLESDPILNDVWVRGEVSGWTRHGSGHCYFSLKADDSSGQMLKCVMWRMNVERQERMNGLPKNGDAVQVYGSIRTYEMRSEYQLAATAIRPVGVGLLYAEFERIKAKLSAEGLFDVERKRPIPRTPRRIGIVTSEGAAVFYDVQNVLSRRYPLAELVLSHTAVQGTDAPAQIVRALERLNARDDIDVILVCRGGGSLEDLWCFNDERVARAIASSRIVVVSGVGHETDVTLADFAADYRAPTPSAAAEVVTPDIMELRSALRSASNALESNFGYYTDTLKSRLNEKAWALNRLSPQTRIERIRQRLDDWNVRMTTHMQHRFDMLRATVDARREALDAANPAAILKRGYTMLTADDGKHITSASDAPPGTDITIQFHDGKRKAKIAE